MGRERSNSRVHLRRLVDPERTSCDDLMKELRQREKWSANELAAYSAAYYGMQEAMARDAGLRNRAYVNARNQIKGHGGTKEPMGDGSTRGQYVIDMERGKSLVGSMARTFNASRAQEYLDSVEEQIRQDEEAFAEAETSEDPAQKRVTAGASTPSEWIDLAVIEHMLQVLIGKKRGGEYVDVRRLRKDLWRFMDIYDSVSEAEASPDAIAEAQRLHDRLTDCNAYVCQRQDRKLDAGGPGKSAGFGVDWGDVFPWLPNMDD